MVSFRSLVIGTTTVDEDLLSSVLDISFGVSIGCNVLRYPGPHEAGGVPYRVRVRPLRLGLGCGTPPARGGAASFEKRD